MHDGAMTTTWTAPAVERAEGPLTGDERAMLQGFLDWHRATLLYKCAGLTGAQLAERAAPPSTLSLLGLIRHLTKVERTWFRRRVAGEAVAPLFQADGRRDVDFDDLDPEAAAEGILAWSVAGAIQWYLKGLGDPPEVQEESQKWRKDMDQIGRFIEECKLADAAVAGVSLDDTFVLDGEPHSLRLVYLHLIQEYARHNGHADLLRQRIDGITGA